MTNWQNYNLANIENRVSWTTHKGYRTNLLVFCDYLRSKNIYKIAKIDLEIIDQFRYYLLKEKDRGLRKGKGVSKNMVNRYLTTIHATLTWGLQYGRIKHTDVQIHKLRKEPVKRPVPRFLSTEEIERILHYDQYISSYCKKYDRETTIPQLIEIVKFLMITGRRIQEVLALKKGGHKD
ncbi:MAG: phage integrase SAM-like domain-containing protein [Candidatus Brocadiaceae bacterium]|nr:phage integrase SAM-like domain-containing protein [Candidatus Brocadiaceae bacterium]